LNGSPKASAARFVLVSGAGATLPRSKVKTRAGRKCARIPPRIAAGHEQTEWAIRGDIATLSNDVQSGIKQPLAGKPSFFDFLRPSTTANILQTFWPVHRPQTSANIFLRFVVRR